MCVARYFTARRSHGYRYSNVSEPGAAGTWSHRYIDQQRRYWSARYRRGDDRTGTAPHHGTGFLCAGIVDAGIAATLPAAGRACCCYREYGRFDGRSAADGLRCRQACGDGVFRVAASGTYDPGVLHYYRQPRPDSYPAIGERAAWFRGSARADGCGTGEGDPCRRMCAPNYRVCRPEEKACRNRPAGADTVVAAQVYPLVILSRCAEAWQLICGLLPPISTLYRCWTGFILKSVTCFKGDA